MKIGQHVEHALDSNHKGRIVFWRKSLRMALVKWDSGECTEHHESALTLDFQKR
jgi:hypothetical protein